MTEVSPGTLAAIGGLAGGMALGFAARWGRFCTLGAIEDACLGGSRGRISAWGLAIAVAIAGTFALDQAGLASITDSFYLTSPTTLLATLFGSFLFGLGMSLVGTCGYGTLARVGGGDLKSVVTFLVLGITAYATMNGLSAYVRVYLFDTPGQLDQPAGIAHATAGLTGGSAHVWAYLIAAGLAALALTSRDLRETPRFLTAGIIVGLAIVSGWFVTGYVANDPFDPHRLESFTFTGPPGDVLIYIMTATGASLEFGIGAVVGVIVGATMTTLAQRHFRWEACDDARFMLSGFTRENSLARYLAGGLLMGFGGVTALGCSVGQGLSGISTASVSSVIAVLAIAAGGYGMMRVRTSRTAAVCTPDLQPAE